MPTSTLYERIAGETEHEHADQQPGVHVARRGTSAQAAQLIRNIIGTRDERARTAHDIAAETEDRAQLPEHVQHLLAGRANAMRHRRNHYRAWCCQASDWAIDWQLSRDQHLSRSRDQGLDCGIDL